MKSDWYIIFNPVSGGGKNEKRIKKIKSLLLSNQLHFQFTSTEYAHHEELLVKQAIVNGYRKFICIGGDGTLHHMVNGIMNQHDIASHKITIAVIPIGTGNDWVKNYKIPSDPKKAIQLIVKHKVVFQDIGRIAFKAPQKEIFFASIALGFCYNGEYFKTIFNKPYILIDNNEIYFSNKYDVRLSLDNYDDNKKNGSYCPIAPIEEVFKTVIETSAVFNLRLIVIGIVINPQQSKHRAIS